MTESFRRSPFSRLLLDPGEYVFSSYNSDMTRTPNTLSPPGRTNVPNKVQVPGRLLVASTNIYFEPENLTLPIVKMNLLMCRIGRSEIRIAGGHGVTRQRVEEVLLVEVGSLEFLGRRASPQGFAVMQKSTSEKITFSMQEVRVADLLGFIAEVIAYNVMHRDSDDIQIYLSGRGDRINAIMSSSQESIEVSPYVEMHLNPPNQSLGEFRATLHTIEGRSPGIVIVTKQFTIFQHFVSLTESMEYDTIISASIVRLIKRKHGGRDCGLEIMLSSPESYPFEVRSFVFPERETRAECESLMRNNFNGIVPEVDLQSVTNSWLKGKMSNLDYILELNFRSGRTMNDITQYPIVPWCLTDMNNGEVDLSVESSFRSFGDSMSSGVGATGYVGLHPMNVAQLLLKKYPEFRYHFSNFTDSPTSIVPVRSFEDQLRTIMVAKDEIYINQELIPEFYIGNGSILQEHLFFPSFDDPSENSMDVKLPKWANNPLEFIQFHRFALESEVTTKGLPAWIDMVFGVNRHSSADDIEMKFAEMIKRTVDEPWTPYEELCFHSFLLSSGYPPARLFTSKHPMRSSTTSSKDAVKRTDDTPALESRISDLKAEEIRLQSESKEKDKEILSLQQISKTLQGDIESHQGTIDSLVEKHELLQRENEKYREKLLQAVSSSETKDEDTTKSIEDLRTIINEKDVVQKQSAKKIDELNEKCHEMKAEKARLEEKIITLEKTLKESHGTLSSEYHSFKSNAQERIAGLEAAIHKFQKECTSSENEIVKLQDQLAVAKKDNVAEDKIVRDLKEKDKEILSLQQISKTLQGDIESHQGTIDSLVEKHELLQRENEKYREKLLQAVSSSETKDEDSTKSIEDLRAIINEKDIVQKQSAKKIDELNEKCHEMKAEKARLEKKIITLEKTLKENDSALSSEYHSFKSNAQERIAGLEAAIHKFQKECTSSDNEIVKLQDQLAVAKKDNVSKDKVVRDLKEKVSSLKMSTEVQEEVRGLTARCERAEKQNADADQQLFAMRKSLRNSLRDLSNKDNELVEMQRDLYQVTDALQEKMNMERELGLTVEQCRDALSEKEKRIEEMDFFLSKKDRELQKHIEVKKCRDEDKEDTKLILKEILYDAGLYRGHDAKKSRFPAVKHSSSMEVRDARGDDSSGIEDSTGSDDTGSVSRASKTPSSAGKLNISKRLVTSSETKIRSRSLAKVKSAYGARPASLEIAERSSPANKSTVSDVSSPVRAMMRGNMNRKKAVQLQREGFLKRLDNVEDSVADKCKVVAGELFSLEEKEAFLQERRSACLRNIVSCYKAQKLAKDTLIELDREKSKFLEKKVRLWDAMEKLASGLLSLKGAKSKVRSSKSERKARVSQQLPHNLLRQTEESLKKPVEELSLPPESQWKK